MKRFKNKVSALRTATVSLAFVLVVSGITLAILQSQQNTLTGNSIETTTANLQMSVDGVIYNNSHGGYDFNGVVPGGPPTPTNGYPFYLRNVGSMPLALRLTISGGLPVNQGGADLSKVNIMLTPLDGGSTQSFTLQALIDGQGGGGVPIAGQILTSGASRQFKLQVSMPEDAVSSSGAAISNIDLCFSGTAVSS